MSAGKFFLVGPKAVPCKVSLVFFLKRIIHRVHTDNFNSLKKKHFRRTFLLDLMDILEIVNIGGYFQRLLFKENIKIENKICK